MTCLGVNSLKFRRLNRKKDEFKEVVQNDSRTLKSGDHQIVFPRTKVIRKAYLHVILPAQRSVSEDAQYG